MRENRNGTRLFFTLCLMILLSFVVGCSSISGKSQAESETTSVAADEMLTVRVLDVGQGEAILIHTAASDTLIDTGDVDEQDKLRRELKAAGVKEISKLILTHPHADHIGGTPVIFSDYTVKEVYDNGEPTTTKLYRTYLKSIKEKGISYRNLKDGDVLELGDGARLEILSPTEAMVETSTNTKGKRNLNINSITARLVYGSFTMLLTGDAEKETELGILDRHDKSELRCDILKVGHHGSKTSSSAQWLNAVKPGVAVISCGKNNDYGHPHDITLKKLEKINAKVYRTDTDGTITIMSDGKTYKISIGRGVEQ
ncbi:ComEC/Rec2 family competence protein [Selenomonas sp. TAMA-11512]|uniref:ComEC/Rec2 family competence protein n=1 Tax=Selenomonas sp. TAMA-11512 TaxID=3095337 RepID=UPI0030CF7853